MLQDPLEQIKRVIFIAGYSLSDLFLLLSVVQFWQQWGSERGLFMTVKELIKYLEKFDMDLPVVSYEGEEFSVVRLNDEDHDVAGNSYDGEPYVVVK